MIKYIWLSVGLMVATVASAAEDQVFAIASAGDVDAVTVRATVKSVDMKTRKVTLVGANGETMTMKAGEQVLCVVPESGRAFVGFMLLEAVG